MNLFIFAHGATPRLRRISFPGGKAYGFLLWHYNTAQARKIEYNSQDFSEFGGFLRKICIFFEKFCKKMPRGGGGHSGTVAVVEPAETAARVLVVFAVKRQKCEQCEQTKTR